MNTGRRNIGRAKHRVSGKIPVSEYIKYAIRSATDAVAGKRPKKPKMYDSWSEMVKAELVDKRRKQK